jgi:hypothetical protein
VAKQPKYGKVVRDGKVAVLYSPSFGAGWYTWNTDYPECIYDPEVVAMLEAKKEPTDEWCKARYGEDFYAGGASDLVIRWLDEDTLFRIEEYDGSESIEEASDVRWDRA